ncbi:hypothetical protein Htur_2597 [Haloterrigena turkmenica DSM 5511]|uniref:Uncharacterized protein n=1 Tax=Haloterrigena turkmenica (strain ATCC 51198 / DSM 5511 / JCM 9101 / NCIMB 13204 / VKM B-1734 / 4k) TaxID=543526 RepID=D2RW45_HALTV|nr:hypothetical protein Htur_2597 [Haloterrigena turkmenica DSM 5511]
MWRMAESYRSRLGTRYLERVDSQLRRFDDGVFTDSRHGLDPVTDGYPFTWCESPLTRGRGRILHPYLQTGN